MSDTSHPGVVHDAPLIHTTFTSPRAAHGEDAAAVRMCMRTTPIDLPCQLLMSAAAPTPFSFSCPTWLRVRSRAVTTPAARGPLFLAAAQLPTLPQTAAGGARSRTCQEEGVPAAWPCAQLCTPLQSWPVQSSARSRIVCKGVRANQACAARAQVLCPGTVK